MGFYEDQILPRFVDVALRGAAFAELRERVTSQVSGEVLEVGFGSGRNVPYYGPSVTRVQAVDPAVVGRKLAAGRVRRTEVPVEYIGIDAQRLPLDDASIDHVLTTWTLCSIPDVRQALAEVHRVLRPGGAFHFIEHGRSPDDDVARWQDRITPWQRRIFGGCHLNRAIDELVVDAGLAVTRLHTYYLKGPRPLSYMYEGIAVRV